MIIWFLLMLYSVACGCVFAAYTPYEMLYDGPKGAIRYIHTDQTLMIDCKKPIRLTESLEKLNTTISASYISIHICVPENTTYVEELQSLNINITGLKTMYLSFVRKKPLPPGNYTEGLKIVTLAITNEHTTNLFRDNQNFLEPLTMLETLTLTGIELPPLPKTMHLAKLSLFEKASVIEWGNCMYLEKLSINRWDDTTAFPPWPSNCTELRILDVQSMLPEFLEIVAEKMSAVVPALRSLKVSYSRLYRLPMPLLRAADNLTYLSLADNSLHDEPLSSFPLLKSLQVLDLSSNPLLGLSVGKVVSKLPKLKELFLNNSDSFYVICNDDLQLREKAILPLQNTSIEKISFQGTYFEARCWYDTHFTNLQYLNLIGTSSTELDLLRLPKSDAGHLEVDFGRSDFVTINFNENDYGKLQQENETAQNENNTTRLSVLIEYVKCDCANALLARALHDFPLLISMPNLHCNYEYGIYILDEDPDKMECEKWDDFRCLYRKSWRDQKVIAECRKEAQPQLLVHGINISGLEISSLPTYFTDELEWVDLRRNRISRMNATEADMLFKGDRSIWLADNLLLCDCDNRVFLDAIQNHKDQIKDYELLTCVDTGEPISGISTDALCQLALVISLSFAGAIIALAGVVALLLRRYGDEIRMYMYARGWCLSWLQKQDQDDKPNDAFLSFAQGDVEYVTNTLLPGLEKAPERYSICVHYRDWLVGDWIPAQIMRSVQTSKRTLILLSRNFVSSVWSTLEFRYAIANAAQEKQAKVLVLVLDDVLDLPLDTELQAYISYNTYLRCDDPWFWEKLRYAMPHRTKKKSRRDDLEMNKRESVVMSGNKYLTVPDLMNSNSSNDVLVE